MKKPIVCGVVCLNTGRILASSTKTAHKLSARLLARELDTIRLKELGQFRGYGKRCYFDSFEFGGSQSAVWGLSSIIKTLGHGADELKTLYTLYTTYQSESERRRYKEGLSEATRILDKMEKELLSAIKGGSLSYKVTGDTHGVDVSGPCISVCVGGVEYSRELVL